MKRRGKLGFICLLLLFLFFIFTFLVINYVILFIDSFFSDLFYEIDNTLILFAKYVSMLASPELVFILGLLLILFLLYNKDSRFAYFYVMVGLTAWLLTEFFKSIIQRARPYNLNLGDYSYPSGHTLMAFAFYGSIVYYFWHINKRIAYIIGIFPFLIGLSRIVLNVHWFSDVIGGLLLGLAVLFFYAWLFYPIHFNNQNKKTKRKK